jgi:hypothetical protein
MVTKIRLLLDFLVQLAVFIFFIVEAITAPTRLWATLGFFALSISTWQILHALYVVRKYKDWQRDKYLANIKQVLAYTFFTLLISGLMWVASFGYLYPFMLFAVEILYFAVCAVVLVLALLYFVQSSRDLYLYFRRPRSFWDL